MSVMALDHVNIRTPDVGGTAAFLARALDMSATPPPGRSDMAMGAWLHDRAGNAIIHVASADALFPGEAAVPPLAPHGSGRLHHVALRCADFDAVANRLDRNGIAYTTNDIPVIKLRQIFVEEPVNGVLLELNFLD